MEKISHIDRVHAKLSGSTAHRWTNCYGSVALVESLPASPPSDAANRGTFVHEACECHLRSFLNKKITGLDYPTYSERFDDEANDTAQNYVQVIWDKVLEKSLTGKAWGIEEEICLDEKLEMWGIVDFWCIYIDDRGRRTLAIVDFKNGYHFVEVTKNAQFIFYASSMVSEIRRGGKDLDFIRTAVYQPRIASGEPFREATYSSAQLDKHTKRFFKAARAILEGSTKLKCGSWCTFCPAQAVCKAYAKDISDKASLALMDKEKIELPKIETLSDEAIKKLVLYGSQIEDFVSAVRTHAVNRHLNGAPIEGVKLINGPTRRTWKEDEEEIAQALIKAGLQEPWQKKLVTITSAEKKLGKETLRDLVTTTKPTLQLVSSDDPRPAIESALDKLGEIKNV